VAVKFQCWKFQVTEFRAVTEWQGALSWAVCITNIDWKHWRHEKPAKTQNHQVFAGHRGVRWSFVDAITRKRSRNSSQISVTPLPRTFESN